MSNKIDNLDALTDAELSECFAVEVAEMTRSPFGKDLWMHLADSSCGKPMPSFATSADAVLPWLEKHDWAKMERYLGRRPSWGAFVDLTDANAPTFARAACLALIRAKRATP